MPGRQKRLFCKLLHGSSGCAAHDFVPVPATQAIADAYLASPAESHAPTAVPRWLSAFGKMH